MFLVYCEKMRLFENPIFKIWAIEHSTTLETFLSTAVYWNVHSILTHLSIKFKAVSKFGYIVDLLKILELVTIMFHIIVKVMC